MAEESIRVLTPDFLRIAGLILFLLVLVFFSLSPGLIYRNRVLVTLPLQRFKWATETYLSSGFNRTASILMCCLAFGIFIYSHFAHNRLKIFDAEYLNFTVLVLGILILFVIKLFAVKFFFAIHNQSDIGTLIIDYQFAFNMILGLILMLIIAFDLFLFRLDNALYISASVIIGLMFLLRLMGSIMLLLNKFSFPLISLFIYLCAFEISPMLVLAKVIFVKS